MLGGVQQLCPGVPVKRPHPWRHAKVRPLQGAGGTRQRAHVEQENNECLLRETIREKAFPRGWPQSLFRPAMASGQGKAPSLFAPGTPALKYCWPGSGRKCPPGRGNHSATRHLPPAPRPSLRPPRRPLGPTANEVGRLSDPHGDATPAPLPPFRRLASAPFSSFHTPYRTTGWSLGHHQGPFTNDVTHVGHAHTLTHTRVHTRVQHRNERRWGGEEDIA